MTVKYAGFGKRLIAAFIDQVILFIISFPISTIFYFIVLGKSSSKFNTALNTTEKLSSLNPRLALFIENILVLLILFVVYWLYFALLESSENQGTYGKQAMNIIVTDINGRRLPFKQSTLRFFGKYLFGLIYFDYLPIFLIWLNSHVMAMYTKKRQALHDIIAKTVVLNKQ